MSVSSRGVGPIAAARLGSARIGAATPLTLVRLNEMDSRASGISSKKIIDSMSPAARPARMPSCSKFSRGKARMIPPPTVVPSAAT